MELSKITEVTNFSINHFKKLSELMVDAELLEYDVFYTQYIVLQNNGGCFFLAKEKSEVVGYIFFSQCVDDPNVMKVLYLSIEKKFRKKGVGTKLLMDSMSSLGKDFYMLCCLPDLEGFYEKSGFVFVEKSLGNKTICMVYKANSVSIDKTSKITGYAYCQPSIPIEFKDKYKDKFR